MFQTIQNCDFDDIAVFAKLNEKSRLCDFRPIFAILHANFLSS